MRTVLRPLTRDLTVQSRTQRLDGAMNRNLERRLAQARLSGRFLERHLAQLEKLDRGALAVGKILDCPMELLRIAKTIRDPAGLVIRDVDWILVDRKLVAMTTYVAPDLIDRPVVRNRHQPGQKRPRWVIGRAGSVQRQQ